MLYGNHPIARHCGVIHDLFVGDLRRTQILSIDEELRNVKSTQNDDCRTTSGTPRSKKGGAKHEISETKYAKGVCFRDAYVARYDARVNKSIYDHTLLPP